MEAARTRRRRRRLGPNDSAPQMDARLVRVGLVVVVPALLALLLAVSSGGPLPRSQLEPLFDGPAASQLAATLSTEYPSRVPGTPEAAAAARWYRETVSALGIRTTEDVWREKLADLGTVSLRNVVSVVPGRSEDAILVVAHRDNAGPAHPSAENASGTAALVELARGFAPQTQSPATAPVPQHTLVFLSTDAGAYGGAGAERFAHASPLAGSVIATLVLDDLAGSARPALAVAGDGASSPPQALVRTASARVAEELGVSPALPTLRTQLADLGIPFAELEQGRLLGAGIAAVTLTAEGDGSAAGPTGGTTRFGKLGKAAEATVDSVDSSVGAGFQTRDALYFESRAVRGWAVRLLLVLLVVPIVLGTVDLYARVRRRRIGLVPALRAMRARLAIWILGAALIGLGALTSVFPTGAALPLPESTSAVSDPPLGAIAVLLATFGVCWLVGRARLVPRRPPTPDERVAGLLVGLLVLCGLAVALAILKPYALVFVLPSLYAWPWIPAVRPRWTGLVLFGLGLLGPLLGAVALAQEVGLGFVRTLAYTIGLATVGYVSVGSVLAAAVWLASAAQIAAVATGRYAAYADGAARPPPGVFRRSVARVLGPRARRA